MRLAVDAVALGIELGEGDDLALELRVVGVHAAVQMPDLDALALEPGGPRLRRTDLGQMPRLSGGGGRGAQGHGLLGIGNLDLEVLEHVGHEGQGGQRTCLHRGQRQEDALVQPQCGGLTALDGVGQKACRRAELIQAAIELRTQVLELGASARVVAELKAHDHAHLGLVTALGPLQQRGRQPRRPRRGEGRAAHHQGRAQQQALAPGHLDSGHLYSGHLHTGQRTRPAMTPPERRVRKP
ncbi:hypothetical protein BOO71_0013777 [Deinococcus marmoris]|uniref:Uncharacterized protein n=1 Tax=Deinococcus marmoris TaxID=249408 RepID=A0A1U7NSB0_9DEIO|nr:hypothetical protein BOO71_0013777 [Deinococcus marmoris]